jgi:hypothetical protein
MSTTDRTRTAEARALTAARRAARTARYADPTNLERLAESLGVPYGTGRPTPLEVSA